MRNTVAQSLLLLLLVFTSCTKNKNNDNILLQAGKYEFTSLDYDMLNTRTNNYFTNPQQMDKLVENAYILAFALDNKYDTIKLLSTKMFYGMRLYSAEVNGYVWNKKVKPNLKVSNDDLKRAYNKRSVQYSIECIGFPTGTKMDKYITSGTNVNTEKSFYALKQHIAVIPEATSSVLQSTYPFTPFSAYTNKIENSKIGDVLGPIETPNGFYLLHVVGIKTVKQPPYNNEKAAIEHELLNVLTERYIMDSQKDILGKASPKMNDKSILYMASRFDNQTRQWPEIDENLILMSYQFKGKRQLFTAGDLKEFINCEPFFIGSPSKANDIKEFMKSYLMDIYLYEEAKGMNAEADEEFIAFKRYYRNKLFVQHYNEQYIYPKMKITASEVQRYYNENKNSLGGFESATVSLYKFRTQQAAFDGLMAIKNFYSPNRQNPASIELKPNNLGGMISVTEGVEINASDTTNDVNLVNAISESDAGQTLMPMKIDGEFCVVYLKNKNGITPLTYKYAKIKIERMLPEKKAQEAHDKQIAGLKAKYPLTINRLKEYNPKQVNRNY
jgi:hypothetical protein